MRTRREIDIKGLRLLTEFKNVSEELSLIALDLNDSAKFLKDNAEDFEVTSDSFFDMNDDIQNALKRISKCVKSLKAMAKVAHNAGQYMRID